MSASSDRLRSNIMQIRERMERAAEKSNRAAEEICLIAVSKYVDLAIIEQLLALGCENLGESRPQSLWSKHEQLALCEPLPRWHFIGHLQRNKVRRTLAAAPFIHSVDSLRLLDEINAEAGKQETACDVLLEVNISGDEAKHGFQSDELENVLLHAAEHSHICIRGLMGMAAREGGSETASRNFSDLRLLRERLRINSPSTISLDELSMGMSNDFEAAISEGATMVRIGSALYDGVSQ